MGTGHSTRRKSFDGSGEVNFDHFQILRAIGKGSFGKVCIVQKKDTKRMFAMKYMNKRICASQAAINNVVRELEMLTNLEHPFLVNLWYAFQDEEDMFMVVDLLLGGDLRYHMQRDVVFSEDCVKLYLCELTLALDYLRTQKIIHRDIKPDNILLDEQGHCHVTDFNIATQLGPGELATSLSGTRPYMAPEMYGVALGQRRGYGFEVDWWALGISLFELIKKRRPFPFQNKSTPLETWNMMLAAKGQPFHIHHFSEGFNDIIRMLLEFEPQKRLCTLSQLQKHSYLTDVNLEAVLSKKITPPFVPSTERLNCDPTYELEEMIIETKPLHKKKKRLAKQNSKHVVEEDKEANELQKLTSMFRYYNRDQHQTSPSSNNMRVAQLGSPTTVGSVRTVACEESNVSNNTYFCPGNNQPQEQQQHNYHPHHRLQEGPTLVIPPHVSTPGQKSGVGVSPSAPVSTDAPSSRAHRASGSGQFQRQQRLPSQKDSSDESDDSDDGAQATCQPDT